MKKKGSGRRHGAQDSPRAARHRFEIPSRQQVLDTLGASDGPVSSRRLMSALGLPSKKQQGAMNARLQAMIRDGQILVNRNGHYCLVDRMPLIIGRVTGHRDGYGFLIPDDGSEDIFLAPRQMREVMHGDRLAVRIKGRDHRGRPEGSVVEVLERNTSEVVGRFVKESGIGFVVPDNTRLTHSIAIPPRKSGRAQPGQFVVARLTEQPGKDTQPVGEVIEVLGAPDAPNIETEVAIRAHGIPFQWAADALSEADRLGTRVTANDKKSREDLRDLPLVTIDGADAKDFDDAVYAERAGAGWRLIVAIADVSHYVGAEGPLDDSARERGNSVYFPRRVVPMLPETLSNGLCSLNPRVDRLCMACEMHVNARGKVTVSRFFPGVMRSHARLIYDEVAAALDDRDSKDAKRLAPLMPRLKALREVYRLLAGARRVRGAIEFEIPEVGFAFDQRGRIARVMPRTRNDAHRMIEECMIAANVEAARFLKRHRVPTLYRVHAGPEEERLEDLAAFLEAYGLRLPRPDRIEPAHYNRIVEKIRGRPDEALIEVVLLRSLPQAVYQPKNSGHFGLALPEYTHFTSPIRRYPDLLVHRAIRHILGGGGARDFRYDQSQMERLGSHCSATERRADDATREALDWLKCEFMQDKIGEEFDAVVTGVVDFGLFIQLPDLQVEGLVHVSALGGEYFHRDTVHRKLVGERSGKSWQLADTLRVRVVRVNLEERKIDFALAGSGGNGRDRGRRGGRR